MNTKHTELNDEKSCLSRAEMDEPIFILRANDPIAPIVVRLWASISQSMEAHKKDKTTGAWLISHEMQAWYEKQYGQPKIDWMK